MSNILEIWNNLALGRKATLVGAVLATVAALAVLANAAATPRMAYLYGGLDAASAGEILSALETMDVRAEVRGDAIYVPEPRRDAIRMTLAQQGLPQQGQPGFELLDGLNGFATSSDMFDAAYWRAKEGELARTILATPSVKSARVHLGVPNQSGLSRRRSAPTGSVTIAMARGRLDLQHATAIRYLVALAVPGLEPDQVAIIDSVNGVVLKPGAESDALHAGGDENDRVQRLEASITDLIEARVGPGNVRVSISLEIDRERETLSERVLDPGSRVVMNRESTEIRQTDQGGGAPVTVASNLPDGDAAENGGSSTSQRSETSEATDFAVSEVNRKREKTPGAVARVSVAVLINDAPPANQGADPVTPRTDEELEAIRQLVASAIGFSEARGDVVTVRSMPFHAPPQSDDFAASNGIRDFLEANMMSILQIVIPAIVVLILALFVIKPVLKPRRQEEDVASGPEVMSAHEEAADRLAPQDAEQSPVETLRDVADKQRKETMTVLTSWLGETEAAA